MNDAKSMFADVALGYMHRRSEVAVATNLTEVAAGEGHSSEHDLTTGQHIITWVTFFVVSVFAKQIGPHMPRVGLPAITGFILVGAACGPYSLNIVEEEGLKSLSYINMFALAFITTSAGAELIIADLKPLIVTMLLSVTCISFLTFGVSTGVIVALSNTSLLDQLMKGRDPACKSAIAMIMATIGMARSPATAIAIVKELRCKGKMTTTFLGITVLSDIFVLIGITITMSFGKSACAGGEFKGESIGVVIAMIIVSVLLGLVVGLGYIALMMSSRFIVTSLIFPFGFLIFLACSFFSKAVAKQLEGDDIQIVLEPLLMCIVGGFICVNFSKYHHRFEECLNQASPYIMLPFFTLVGAGLNLPVFVRSLPFAIILCIARTICIFFGSALPGFYMKQSKSMNLTLWMTLLSQAGFSLGLAAEVAHAYPGWGKDFQAVIISCVVVNQLIGPILCKVALKWSKESGVASGNEAHEEAESDPNAVHIAELNKCVILGTTPSSKSLALHLLKERWGVTMLTVDEEEADALQVDIKEWAKYMRADLESYHITYDLPPPTFPVVPLEDNFMAQPVPNPDDKNPFMLRSASIDNVVAKAALKILALEPHLDAEANSHSNSCMNSPSKFKSPGRAEIEMSRRHAVPPFPEEESGPKELSHTDGELEAQVVDDDDDEHDVRISLDGDAYGKRKASLAARSFDDRCDNVYKILDGVSSLKVVVLALADDLAALTLLDKIQDHFRDANTHSKVRFVVLMQGLRWAEAFSMLDAIPIHEFVATQHMTAFATTSSYNKDCVLMHGKDMTGPDTMSDAFLNLFDGPLLHKCAPGGESLQDFSDANNLAAKPSIKLLNILRTKMQARKTTFTGGRMLRSIDEWIQKSLDNLAESDEFARSDSLDTKGHKYLDLEGQHTKVEADGLTKRHTVAI
mmetsp:Transcript_72151/g.105746  ORF Transcript_72151/g.105746 Transcript_72151/m.105746 type:complete len:917 (-) Transcript_72151:538-3288(-)